MRTDRARYGVLCTECLGILDERYNDLPRLPGAGLLDGNDAPDVQSYRQTVCGISIESGDGVLCRKVQKLG